MQLCKIPNHSLQTFSIPKSFLQYILPAAFFTASNIQGSRLIWKDLVWKTRMGVCFEELTINQGLSFGGNFWVTQKENQARQKKTFSKRLCPRQKLIAASLQEVSLFE